MMESPDNDISISLASKSSNCGEEELKEEISLSEAESDVKNLTAKAPPVK
jgi:hypothetical protein